MRRKRIQSQHKELLVRDILEKQQRASFIQQRKEQLIKQSVDRNSYLQGVVVEVAQKNSFTMQPVTYETHIAQWKEDLKRRRREKAEGGHGEN